MDSVTFCGETCHTVMQPEYTAYQNSPHSRVECVKCHIGPGAGWFVKSKLSGVGQVFAVTFNTYPRPIPTPVHNLRPARETCEACHWPQKYGEDRIERDPQVSPTTKPTPLTKTVLLMKIGGGNNGIGIHGTHLGPGVVIRLRPLRRSPADHSLGGVQQQRQVDRLRHAGRQARWRRRPDHARDGLHGLPQPPVAQLRPARARPRQGHGRRPDFGHAAVRQEEGRGDPEGGLPVRDEAARRDSGGLRSSIYQQSYPAVWAQRQARSDRSRRTRCWPSTTATSSPT